MKVQKNIKRVILLVQLSLLSIVQVSAGTTVETCDEETMKRPIAQTLVNDIRTILYEEFEDDYPVSYFRVKEMRRIDLTDNKKKGMLEFSVKYSNDRGNIISVYSTGGPLGLTDARARFEGILIKEIKTIKKEDQDGATERTFCRAEVQTGYYSFINLSRGRKLLEAKVPNNRLIEFEVK